MKEDFVVRLPQWGMAMTEGLIIEWLRVVGDTVAEGEAIALIEAEKVEAELESPCSGTLTSIVVSAGDTAQVFDVLATIREE